MRKLSRHHLWKQIIAIFWIQVFVTKRERNTTNEEESASPHECASQWRLPSVLVVTRVRWFRGLGGREGTALVSGVVSVGGFVSFDSSNGAQARM